MKAVYIEWCDAITKEKSWMTKSEALEWANSTQWINKHVGFIIEENSDYILLAGEIGQMTGDDIHLGHVTKIPFPWILKRIELIV
jgi:hypothetical protein